LRKSKNKNFFEILYVAVVRSKKSLPRYPTASGIFRGELILLT